jgi:ferredoxin
MLDGGLRLEPDRQRIADQMASSAPGSWTPAQFAAIHEGMEPGPEGIPLKRLFGSDFVFRNAEAFSEITCEGADTKSSLALGGLSNVWGAGALPFSAEDINDWPLPIDAFAPYYRECFEDMPLSAANDALAHRFPLFTEGFTPLQVSSQARSFLIDLERSREKLRRNGIEFGLSRLAVRVRNTPAGLGCVYCGQCLYGCPYGCIYNSSDTLRALKENPNFIYQGDVIVQRLEERGSEVLLHGHSLASHAPLTFKASQAFLGCGAIASTAILLESLGAWDKPIEMKDSRYFIFPVSRFKRTEGVEHEALHTLAQVFFEIQDREISKKNIHISVYSYNDLLLKALQKQTGVLGRVFPNLPLALARRLLIFGGYLHSNESPGLTLAISRSGQDRRKINLIGGESPGSDLIVKKLLRKLARLGFAMRALPLIPAVRTGLPGRGFHTGGSFPMRSQPATFQSDLLGRPFGFTRVHVVDATVFPSIPAPNLTLTVMANAKRIAAESSVG